MKIYYFNSSTGTIVPGPGHIENLSIRVFPCSHNANCEDVFLQDKQKNPLFNFYTEQSNKVLLYVDTDNATSVGQNTNKSYISFDHKGHTLVIDRKDLNKTLQKALFLVGIESQIEVTLYFDLQDDYQKKYKITLSPDLIPVSQQIF